MTLSRHDVEQQLRDRTTVLQRRHAAMESHLRGQDGRLEVDDVERSSWSSGDEVLEHLDDAALAELAELQGALARLEAGTWGTCTACGDDIATGRLAALPSTAFCAACAR